MTFGTVAAARLDDLVVPAGNRLEALNLERIADYLFSYAPEHAPRPIRSIYEAPETLLSFPHRGRPRERLDEIVLHRAMQRARRKAS